ncbi:MAG TPA: complex I NDUFA9 subunit family protein [Burkholderiales bacterium]|nr:complex I NDUFA9 subunit family protein [Burkholderiales bacterium]
MKNILVLGGSGFVGRHLIAQLTREMSSATVPSRRRERAKHLIVFPTVEVVQADVFDAVALERLARGKDAVVNLVGSLHGDLERAHVELPRRVLAACRSAGVTRLLHMSALGASADAPSRYLRTKAAGEEAVLAARDLDVTVFRPSVVFGPEDRFLNMFACFARFTPVLAVPCPKARFQPVYVGDVARAMVAALDDPEARGRAYELCGPREYTLHELVAYACAVSGHSRLILDLPDGLSYLQAALLERLPGPLMSRDNYRSMQKPSVSSGGAPLPFGLAPQALEALAPGYLAPSANLEEHYSQLRWKARR